MTTFFWIFNYGALERVDNLENLYYLWYLNEIEFAVSKFHQMFSNENICKVTKEISIILNPQGRTIK